MAEEKKAAASLEIETEMLPEPDYFEQGELDPDDTYQEG